MTENTPTVGGDGAGGNQPPVSNQPIEGEAERLSKLFDARLSEALKPVLAEVRGVQSRQDKDRKGFQEVLDEFKKLKAKGLSDEEAEIAMLEGRKASEKDDLLYKMAQKLGVLESPSAQPAGNGVSGADATDKAIEELGLPQNDAGVLKIRAETPDPTQRLIALAKYAKTFVPQPPDASAAPALNSAPASTTKDATALTKEYREKMLAIPRGPKGNDQRAALKAEYAGKGADVNNVIFS